MTCCCWSRSTARTVSPSSIPRPRPWLPRSRYLSHILSRSTPTASSRTSRYRNRATSGSTLIDLATRSVVRTLPLDKTPRDAEFGYDGKLFYFTQAGVSSVQVLDPASDRIVAQIPTGVSPHFVSYPRGSAFGIVVVQGPSELLLFDPATNKPARSVAVGKQPHWATTSSDGKTTYVTNEGSNDVTIVDLATGKTQTIPVGNAPRKVVVQRTAGSAS